LPDVVSLRIGEKADEGHGQHASDEAVLVHELLVREQPPVDPLEQPAVDQQDAPVATRSIRCLASQRLEDLRERPVNLVPLVARVPEQCEPTARRERAVDLAQSPLRVEPVKGGADGDRVDGAVRDRDALCRPRKRGDARYAPLELGPHLR
jgi:hypothetical protein